jgi:hypothetical protein
MAGPGAAFRLRHGDTLVAAGEPEGVAALAGRLG